MSEFLSKLKKLFSIHFSGFIGYNSGVNISGSNMSGNKIVFNGNSADHIPKVILSKDAMYWLKRMSSGSCAVVPLDESGMPEQVNLEGSNEEMPLEIFRSLVENGLIYEAGKEGDSIVYAITESGRKILHDDR